MTKHPLTRIRKVVSRTLAKRDRVEMAAVERIIALLEPADRRSRAARPTRARTPRARAAAAHRRRP